MSSSDISDDRKRIKDAAYNGQLQDIIDLSTKFNNDVKLMSETLVFSCSGGHLNVVKWIMEHTAADVNYTGVIRVIATWKEEVDNYFTPLTAVCQYKHLDVVKYLVETSRVDVNLSDSQWGYTPLIIACISANITESIYLLCKVRDLDVNIAGKSGYTDLHFAASSSKDLGFTKLHWACIKGDVTEVMKLVSIDDQMINVQSNGGYTPLHYACRFSHSDIVKTLMLAGADETITTITWKTPAQVAVEKGHRGLLKLLDRVTLLEVMQTSNKLSVVFLVLLILQLMQLQSMRKKWCH